MKTLLALLLLIPSLSWGENKIYFNLKDFITYSLSANKMISLCKDNNDQEKGKYLMIEILFSALNDNLITESQMNEIQSSFVKIEDEATIIVSNEGCDYANSLIYTNYANRLLEIRKFFDEEGLFE
jgi:hypothetical protein